MNILINIIELSAIYYLSIIYLNIKRLPKSIDFLLLLVNSIILAYIPDKYPLIVLLYAHISLIIYFVFYRSKKNIDGFVLYMLCFLSIYVFQIIAAIIMVFLPLPDDQKLQGVIGNSLALLVTIIYKRIAKPHRLYNLIIGSSAIYKAILIYTYICQILVVFVVKCNIKLLKTDIILLSTVVILFFISNACLIAYERKHQIQSAEIAIYKKNLPIYETLINDVRSNQHEYNNQLQALKALPLTYKDYDSLVGALNTYGDAYTSQNHTYALLTIDKPLLAATLYNLSSVAQNKGIDIMFDIAAKKINSKLIETKLADVCSIILNNAIDESKSGALIYVHITSFNGRMRFEVRNNCDRIYKPEEISRFFEPGYSTKPESKSDGSKHGYGLNYALKTVNNLGGMIGGKSFELEKKKWMLIFFEV